MKVNVIIPFTIQYASQEVCDQFKKPYGTIELLDEDGLRQAWAVSEQEAKDKLHDLIAETGLVGFNFAEPRA